MELNIRLTVLVVETARLERRGVNDSNIVVVQATYFTVKCNFKLLFGGKQQLYDTNKRTETGPLFTTLYVLQLSLMTGALL